MLGVGLRFESRHGHPNFFLIYFFHTFFLVLFLHAFFLIINCDNDFPENSNLSQITITTHKVTNQRHIITQKIHIQFSKYYPQVPNPHRDTY